MNGIGRIRALALLVCISISARASAQELVDFGDTITDPGVYFLNGNQSGSGDGIKIEANDVTLFLLRFTLRGDGTGSGISMIDQHDVTIWGGRVTNFDYGAFIEQSRYVKVRDTRFDDCDVDGIFLDQVVDSEFVRIRTDHNAADGISANNTRDSRFFSVRSDNNGDDGLDLAVLLHVTGLGAEPMGPASGNRIKKCWFAYNHDDGLHLFEADHNEVLENQCVANERVGIHLDTLQDDVLAGSLGADEGSRDNDVERNWCPANGTGIAVEWGCAGNHLVENIALASFDVDLYDGNAPPPCANTWFLNTFFFRGGAGAVCIF